MIRKIELMCAVLGVVLAIGWLSENSLQVSSAQETEAAANENEQKAPVIVVVNMSKVLASSQQYLGLRKKLTEELKDAKNESAEMVKRLNELKTDLRKFPRGSDGYETIREEMNSLTTKLKSFSESGKRKAEKMVADTSLEIFKTARKEIKAYARENKIQLVQNYNDKQTTSTDPKRILASIGRNILYADLPDITEAIIQRVDAQNARLERPGASNERTLALQ